MFFHVVTLVLLLLPADGPGQPVTATPGSEKLTKLTVDEMTFTARDVRFQSENGVRTFLLKGDAKVGFGDIEITADTIQGIGEIVKLESIICTGNCTWQQEDGSGEVITADKLELQNDGLRFTGNASLRYGSSDQQTVITCDSIVIEHGKEGCQFSGEVRLRRSK